MRNKIGMFLALLAAGVMAAVISMPASPCEGQSRPKLDCQKMALDYAQALENLDYQTVVRLTGQQFSKEDEAQAKEMQKSPEAKAQLKAQLAPVLEAIRTFPKIEEIPDWVTEVKVEYQYIQGNELIEMHGEFVFKEGNWIIQDLEPRGGETLNEQTKAQYAGEISPAPPEGQKTLDAGFGGLITKLISAVQQKSWNGVSETGAFPGDVGLNSSDPPERREKVLKLLPQFPSIGSIPAPAKSFRLGLTGSLSGKESEAEIGFQWPGNTLKIAFVNFK
jgi:hypothetical protein